jgi:hypothetical protein
MVGFNINEVLFLQPVTKEKFNQVLRIGAFCSHFFENKAARYVERHFSMFVCSLLIERLLYLDKKCRFSPLWGVTEVG